MLNTISPWSKPRTNFAKISSWRFPEVISIPMAPAPPVHLDRSAQRPWVTHLKTDKWGEFPHQMMGEPRNQGLAHQDPHNFGGVRSYLIILGILCPLLPLLFRLVRQAGRFQRLGPGSRRHWADCDNSMSQVKETATESNHIFCLLLLILGVCVLCY